MTLSRFFRRLIAGDKAGGKPGERGAASMRNAIVWIFITLVALFLTEQHSLFDGPVPLPPELARELAPGPPA